MSSSDAANDYFLTDIKGDKGVRPSFSAYWEQHFAGRQLFVVDFKSQFYT